MIADAVVVATSPPDALPDRLMALGPVLLVGVIGQVLLGSLLHLLPVVLGGGPPAVRGAAAVMERGWLVRLVALNAAVLLVAVPGERTRSAGFWSGSPWPTSSFAPPAS